MSEIKVNMINLEAEVQPAWLRGEDGEDGATFTPAVDEAGNLSWTNDAQRDNPPTVNIMGPTGPTGPTGDTRPQGEPGKSPYVSPEDGYWYEWDAESGAYKSTGVKADQAAAEEALAAARRADQAAEAVETLTETVNQAAKDATEAASSASAAAAQVGDLVERTEAAGTQATASAEAADAAAQRVEDAVAQVQGATDAADEAARQAGEAAGAANTAAEEAILAADGANDAADRADASVLETNLSKQGADNAAKSASAAAQSVDDARAAAEAAARQAQEAARQVLDAIASAESAARAAQAAAELANQAAAGTGLKMKLVDQLPEELEANTLYLVRRREPNPQNACDEYVLADGQPEKIGSTEVDLSGYVQKEEGKVLSSNDYTDEDKQKLTSLEPARDGKDGEPGEPGEDGTVWYTGTLLSGTSSTLDNYSSASLTGEYTTKDYYLNSSYGYYYQCTTPGTGSAAKWTYRGSLRGATGSTGSPGRDGNANVTYSTTDLTPGSSSLATGTLYLVYE